MKLELWPFSIISIRLYIYIYINCNRYTKSFLHFKTSVLTDSLTSFFTEMYSFQILIRARLIKKNYKRKNELIID